MYNELRPRKIFLKAYLCTIHVLHAHHIDNHCGPGIFYANIIVVDLVIELETILKSGTTTTSDINPQH